MTPDSNTADQDDTDEPLCDINGCENIPRYVKTDDGHKTRNPMMRCDDHKPTTGLWRDMLQEIRPVFEEYLTTPGEQSQ